MNQEALIKMMESLKLLRNYQYSKILGDGAKFDFSDLNSKEFMIIFDVIEQFDLRYEIKNGLTVWL